MNCLERTGWMHLGDLPASIGTQTLANFPEPLGATESSGEAQCLVSARPRCENEKRRVGAGDGQRRTRAARARLRVAAVLAWVVAAVILTLEVTAFGASDPYLEWRTIETEHFRIHYYRGLEPIAERVASVAEAVNRRIERSLGSRLSQVTEIVLTDMDDHANGAAVALPYNTISLHVAAPDDLFELGMYDDWYLTLITHEHTHIVHTDQIRGLPALFNAVFGRRMSPNQAQPKWVLEGLAVLQESRFTSGGRNRSSVFDMFLRADVLDDRVATIDQVSNVPRRWPQHNLWYLYGSRFVEWLADLYGDDVWKVIAADYGGQVVSWGINRSVRRATGRTYEDLYPAWVRHIKSRYASQLDDVQKRGGVREGRRLTHHGQLVSGPRFVPAVARKGTEQELLFFRDDGRSRSGLYRLPFSNASSARQDDEELVVRTSGQSGATFEPDGSLIYSSVATTKRVYWYNDLFRIPPHSSDASAYDGTTIRLTTGERAQDPDVSPNGTSIVFTKNDRGTTTLMIAERSPDGGLAPARPLVASAAFEQAYTPRFSPNGRTVAYSAWTRGGYRDIRIVDVSSGAFVELSHDRAMDWQPVFSPDGRYLYFSSDRSSGIPNIFAFDCHTHELWQVTNVRTGAFYPAISPDGTTLVYVGYTSYGYDLFAMPIDRASWVPAPRYTETRAAQPVPSEDVVTGRHSYDPFSTLRPRSYQLSYAPGTFGNEIQLGARATDVVGLHSFEGALRLDSEYASDPQLALSYTYSRLPFDLTMSVSRYLSPIQYRDGGPLYVQSTFDVASSLEYALRSPFEANYFSFYYALSRGQELHPPVVPLDPDAPIERRPTSIQLASVGMSWNYSTAESYLNTVGGSARGLSLGVSARLAAPALASDHTLYVFKLSAIDYLPIPWAPSHTLALRAEGGISGGNLPNRSIFYLGGFADEPLVEPPTKDLTRFTGKYQDPFVVRGYAPRKFSGTQYQLFTAEYRFPLINVDRGYSTLPLFLRRISGAAFADFGGAFDELGIDRWTDQLHLGAGAELWFELIIGYYVNTFARVGHARGINDPTAEPDGQTYIVLSLPY